MFAGIDVQAILFADQNFLVARFGVEGLMLTVLMSVKLELLPSSGMNTINKGRTPVIT